MTINALQICGGPADVAVNSSDVGATMGGVLIKADIEDEKVFVDQSTMVIKKLAKKKEAQVEFVAAQATSANLQLALGVTGNGFGGNSASPEYPITVVGVGPSSTVRTFTFHKASVAGSVEIKNDKGAVIGIKMTFDVIADLTKPEDQQLFTWSEV